MADINIKTKENFTKVIEGVAHDLQQEFKDAAPKDMGFLMRNIDYKIDKNVIKFSFPNYAEFLEYGTGIYGPKHQPIKPKSAKALHWKKGGVSIFAKEIKGMRPQPFIRPTIHQKLKKIIVKNMK